MATLNTNYNKLSAGYLFPEIAKRTRLFLNQNPDAKIMKLGIGNTTEPLTPTVIQGLHKGVDRLADIKTYSGYGDEQGLVELREAILDRFYRPQGVELETSEIFVSDGAKPDSGNIQSVFGTDNIVAVQDPAYPVYVDTNVIAGRTGPYNKQQGKYEGIVYMKCTAENGFFPDLPSGKTDLIYLCSPNNPTGTVAGKEQLKTFVDYAIKHQAIIIFDAAYAAYIQDENLPKSIYEVDGAERCAIEINSFSKTAGFTGVRLGWSVVPKALKTEDSEAGIVNRLWNRRQSTFFNGASNIVQYGGISVLSDQGWRESQELIQYYMTNAKIIREGLTSIGMTSYGGDNAPYIWMKTPGDMTSWDFFDKLIQETHVVGTPGSGFGPGGEGYFRLSAFGHRQDIESAMDSIKTRLQV